MRFVATIAIFCLWFTISGAGAAERYGFAWGADWSWERLQQRASIEPPPVENAVAELRRHASLARARVVCRQLARLDTLRDLSRLAERSYIDRRTNRMMRMRATLAGAFPAGEQTDDFAGIVRSAATLARIRASNANWFVPDPMPAAFPPAIAPGSTANRVRIQLDPGPAMAALRLLTNPQSTDAERQGLVDLPAFREMLVHRGAAALTRDQLIEWLRRAQDPAPLNRLYEWVFPESYYDFGGVAAMADEHRAILESILANREEIARRIGAELARVLPDDLKLDTTVSLLYAGDVDGWATSGALGIDLEHFGGDMDYLTRVITHECCHRAQARALVPIPTLAAPGSIDHRFYSGAVAAAWREGMACYAGPVWRHLPTPEERSEAAREFAAIYDSLYAKRDLAEYDQRVRAGLTMAGALYKLGYAAADQIARADGPRAVAQLQTLGPAAFFARYVQLSRNGRVPEAERLRPDIEAALLRLSAGLDGPSMLEAARIARIEQPAAARREALAFARKARANPKAGIALVQLGDRFAHTHRDAQTAAALLMPGMRMLGPRAVAVARRESDALASLGAVHPAATLLRIGLNANRQ